MLALTVFLNSWYIPVKISNKFIIFLLVIKLLNQGLCVFYKGATRFFILNLQAYDQLNTYAVLTILVELH